MGGGADELSDDFLFCTGNNGSYRRRTARTRIFLLADHRNADGGVCIPRRLGVCNIPAESLHGKFDDLLSGIVGIGINGQRRNVVFHLPENVEKCQSASVR